MMLGLSVAIWVWAWVTMAEGLDVAAMGNIRPAKIIAGVFCVGIGFALAAV